MELEFENLANEIQLRIIYECMYVFLVYHTYEDGSVSPTLHVWEID